MSNLTAEVYAILNQSNIKLRPKREQQKNAHSKHDGPKSKAQAASRYIELQNEIEAETERALNEAVALCKSAGTQEAVHVMDALKVYVKYINTPKADRVLNDIFKGHI